MHYQQLINQLNVEETILFQIEKTSKLSKLYSQREIDALGIDITIEQWILLKIIDEHNGLTQKELADRTLRDPASITRTLDILSKKGFIERQSVPENRRQYSIALQKKGSDFIKSFFPIVQKQRAQSINGISNKDIESLNRILKKIQENMS